MQFLIEQFLDHGRAASGDFAIVAGRDFSTLHSQRFVHDRASPSNELQVGDGAATGRLASRGGEGSEGSGGGVLEEGTHALGLAEEGLHVVDT